MAPRTNPIIDEYLVSKMRLMDRGVGIRIYNTLPYLSFDRTGVFYFTSPFVVSVQAFHLSLLETSVSLDSDALPDWVGHGRPLGPVPKWRLAILGDKQFEVLRADT